MKCINIKDEPNEENKYENQSGGTNEKEDPKPEFYESLTKDKIQKCTLDETPNESEWWNDEEKYVQINSNTYHINANKNSISISDKDTHQDVYMTWTDYIKLMFDTISSSTGGTEQDFSFVPETTYIRLKDEEGENGRKYSTFNHTLKLIKYDVSNVILKADNETNEIRLPLDTFKRLFHSAGGGGVVNKNTDTDVDTIADSKNKMEGTSETKPEEKQETKEYTIITLKQNE